MFPSARRWSRRDCRAPPELAGSLLLSRARASSCPARVRRLAGRGVARCHPPSVTRTDGAEAGVGGRVLRELPGAYRLLRHRTATPDQRTSVTSTKSARVLVTYRQRPDRPRASRSASPRCCAPRAAWCRACPRVPLRTWRVSMPWSWGAPCTTWRGWRLRSTCCAGRPCRGRLLSGVSASAGCAHAGVSPGLLPPANRGSNCSRQACRSATIGCSAALWNWRTCHCGGAVLPDDRREGGRPPGLGRRRSVGHRHRRVTDGVRASPVDRHPVTPPRSAARADHGLGGSR